MRNPAVAKKFREDLENTASAIIAARGAGQVLTRQDREIRGTLQVLEESLRAIVTDEKGAADRMRLMDRITKLREYLNMASLGSFQIDIDRAMQAAWERQP
jgi:hypothetical protein